MTGPGWTGGRSRSWAGRSSWSCCRRRRRSGCRRGGGGGRAGGRGGGGGGGVPACLGGGGAWPISVQDRLAEAVFHALFGLGRLQPLVDDDRVENIVITGHDRVLLELTDGRTLPGEPVAGSDQELVDFLVFLASRSEVNARP